MTGTAGDWLPGVHAAPNIQTDPDAYEIENRAVDPDGRIEAAMRAIADWAGRDVLDLGAGTGFHVPALAATARHVYAVEPHDQSRVSAMERCARLGVLNASVLTGSAEAIPLRDGTVDVVHARFAYFWGAGSEPGIAEVRRVLRPGGTAFVIDNDLRTGTFASWLRRSSASGGRDAAEVEQFWVDQGFSLTTIPSAWRFERRADLERVVRNEFPAELARELIAEHAGLEVEYVYALYARTF
jgi:SAM-dependent methyltransferase